MKLSTNSIKKALKLPKSISNNQLLVLGGTALAGFAALWYLSNNNGISGLFNPTSRANYASDNAMNSLGVWPVGHQNNSRPFLPQVPLDMQLPRSFNNYTLLQNALPTPFVEVNVPRDYFNTQVELNNMNDKGTYVQTLDGQGAFGHTG